jgi:hypothetical protein
MRALLIKYNNIIIQRNQENAQSTNQTIDEIRAWRFRTLTSLPM